MFFSIIFGIACGGMIISILGLINPSWIGSDSDNENLIYESLKGWSTILFVVMFFYDADSFNKIAWLVSTLIVMGMNYLKVEILD